MPHVDPNAPPESPPVVLPPTFPPRGPAPGPIGRPRDPSLPRPGSDADVARVEVLQFLCGLGQQDACTSLAAEGKSLNTQWDPVNGVFVEGPAPTGTPPAPSAPVPGATPPFVGPALPPLEAGTDPITRAVRNIFAVIQGVFQRGPLARGPIISEGAGSDVLPSTFPGLTVPGHASAHATT